MREFVLDGRLHGGDDVETGLTEQDAPVPFQVIGIIVVQCAGQIGSIAARNEGGLARGGIARIFAAEHRHLDRPCIVSSHRRPILWRVPDRPKEPDVIFVAVVDPLPASTGSASTRIDDRSAVIQRPGYIDFQRPAPFHKRCARSRTIHGQKPLSLRKGSCNRALDQGDEKLPFLGFKLTDLPGCSAFLPTDSLPLGKDPFQFRIGPLSVLGDLQPSSLGIPASHNHVRRFRPILQRVAPLCLTRHCIEILVFHRDQFLDGSHIHFPRMSNLHVIRV